MDAYLDCLLIPNGVDLQIFKPHPTKLEGGPLRIICVGRLIERKGQHHLIEAMKRLADEGIDATLDLVGTGDARAANEAQVARLGLAGRVRFLGYVPREEIAAQYAAADVFVLPSFNEGMSVALLEAMASGLAVVVTPTGGTPELIEPEKNGLLFDHGDVTRLTEQLRRLSLDRSLAGRMGAESRRRAEEFSWKDAARCYAELLAHLGNPLPAESATVKTGAHSRV